MSANSAIITGGLSYDNSTNVISQTDGLGHTYLGWDVAAELTLSQTLKATDVGGAYEDYHIANYSEALSFFSLATGLDVLPGQFNSADSTAYGDHIFGNNLLSGLSLAWFMSDNGKYANSLRTGHGFISVNLRHGRSLSSSDIFSKDGNSSGEYVSWLLVSDPANVPEPATLSQFVLGLAGLVFTRRQKKS